MITLPLSSLDGESGAYLLTTTIWTRIRIHYPLHPRIIYSYDRKYGDIILDIIKFHGYILYVRIQLPPRARKSNPKDD